MPLCYLMATDPGLAMLPALLRVLVSFYMERQQRGTKATLNVRSMLEVAELLLCF